jgi:hypothetical protein
MCDRPSGGEFVLNALSMRRALMSSSPKVSLVEYCCGSSNKCTFDGYVTPEEALEDPTGEQYEPNEAAVSIILDSDLDGELPILEVALERSSATDRGAFSKQKVMSCASANPRKRPGLCTPIFFLLLDNRVLEDAGSRSPTSAACSINCTLSSSRGSNLLETAGSTTDSETLTLKYPMEDADDWDNTIGITDRIHEPRRFAIHRIMTPTNLFDFSLTFVDRDQLICQQK